MHRRMSARAARRLSALLLALLAVVGAGSPALASPATAEPAAAPAVGGIDIPCVLPAGMCKEIKETGKEAFDATVGGAKWVCDGAAKKVCEVAGDAARGVKDGVGGAVDTVSDTIASPLTRWDTWPRSRLRPSASWSRP